MEIRVDDLTGLEIISLLEEHLSNMRAITPPQSVHALPVEGLRNAGVTFWSVWEKGELLGCGALKELDPQHGEIKSMRTVAKHLRQGVARAVFNHIMSKAKRRGYRRLRLETGAMPEFEPARSCMHEPGLSFASRSRITSRIRTACS